MPHLMVSTSDVALPPCTTQLIRRPQAITFSWIIIRAAQGRTYPKVNTSILGGSLRFMRRSRVSGTGTGMATVRTDNGRSHSDGVIAGDEGRGFRSFGGVAEIDLENGLARTVTNH